MPAPRHDLAPLLDESTARLLLAADPPAECHLVGGVTRDWLLRAVVSRDWDLIVGSGGEAFAGRLAEHAPGRLVRPGGGRFAIFRVVAAAVRIDVWDRRGQPLDEELARRDFTVNSIAVDIRTAEIHDPLGGLADLRAQRLRANRSDTFEEDPLRVLRLLRFELVLPGFTPVAGTAATPRRAAAKLDGVAPERVREELDRILACREAERLGERLERLDLHPRLWSPDDGRSSDATTRDDAKTPPRGADLDELDRLLGATEHLSGRSTEPAELVVLRHAALLSSAGGRGASAEPLLQRGYASRRQARAIDELLQIEPPPSSDAEDRLFLHRAGRSWPLWVTFGAWRSEPRERRAWSEASARLARLAASEGERIFDPPPLLRGDEIAERLDLEPGPELGRIVERLRRLQISGRIETPEAARRWLRGATTDLPPPRG